MRIACPGVVRLLLIAALLLVPALANIASGQASSPAAENGGRRAIEALRIPDGQRVTLDGRFDEPFWANAIPSGDFVQIDPANGQAPTERTEVRIAFDADALYIAVTCYDSDPDGWIAYQMRRDEGLPSDDKIRWTIDTFLDARSGYFFEMNPLGHMADALMGGNGQNRAWDGIWNARARRSEIGWTLEIELPFRTFNFNPNSDTWGFNIERTVQRKNEISIWTGWRRNQGLQRMTNAGLITGIRNVTQGRGLDIKPYGVYLSESAPGRGGSRTMTGNANAGVDLFYNPTPLLRTNVTVNTDFAQTEVDQRQVNLTRFSLLFPEQRDFFLDGSTFLDFASAGGGGGGFQGGGAGNDDQIIPFQSRRVGLSTTGAPQKVDFGGKLTGQVGAQDVGILHVRTGEEDDKGFASEDFTAVRVKRRLLAQSYVGAIYTRRDPLSGAGRERHTTGVDLSMATNGFLGSQNLEANAWFLNATPAAGVSSTNTSAFGANVEYPNDRWNASFKASDIQEDFDPAVGFLRRRGIRRYVPYAQFAPRPRGHRYIRQIRFNASLDVITDRKNELLNRDIDLTLFGLQLQSGDNLSVNAIRRHERLDSPFRISQGITLPLGAQYDYNRFRVFASTANRRVLAFNGRFEFGDFYSGTRTQRNVNLTVRARPGLILYLTGDWNTVSLREGTFSTRLYRLIGETQFSPFMALVNDVQYDTQSSVIGWQSRFRWILTPGTDLYVVYTHNWLDDIVLDRLTTLDKRAASKILYTYRF